MSAQREPQASRLEMLLLAWADSQLQGEESSGAIHPLERARQFAPGKRNERKLSRARQAIRLLTGSPAWGRTAIPCIETRVPITAYSPLLLSDASRVETAYQALKTKHPELAACLHLRYCASGGVSDKARKLGLTVGKFRDGVASARNWVGCWLGA